MTAEIAVLNKSAVALAADSAVTIGRPPNSKIYNTVNKIFELSSIHPVGIMIYGSLDFLGMPLETLIKVYRSKLGTKGFDRIEQYCDDFIRFLTKDVECVARDEERCVRAILTETFRACNAEISTLIYDDIRKRGKYLRSKENAIAQTYFKTQIKELQSRGFATGFSSKQFQSTYTPILDDCIKRFFRVFVPTTSTKTLISTYAGYVLYKDKLSDARTGVVIVGFGDEELCPQLSCFEMDGVIGGKLKYVQLAGAKIAKIGRHAEIMGFAQDDVIQSFINGIDHDIKAYYENSIRSAVSESALEILKALLKDDAKARVALKSLQPTIDRIADDVNAKADEHVKEASSEPIRDMVRSMPKQELAMLASSLIELTSLKRKVSPEQETVGGDVDLAVISKSEGFVWVQRKHYFPEELNRRFFERHYTHERGGGDGSRKPK